MSDHRLRAHAYTADVDTRGASLRTFAHDGRPLVLPYPNGAPRPSYRGATLAPWTNLLCGDGYRTAETVVRFGDDRERLHGLVADADFALARRTPSRIDLVTEVTPSDDYPWRLAVTVRYRLHVGGLTQTVTATNTGDGRAPWGCGGHPYVVAGPSPLEEWTLRLPAAQVLLVDPDLVPQRLLDVAHDSGRFDFRRGRPIGDTLLDHAFTGLETPDARIPTVQVRDPSGCGVEIEMSEACGWVQLYTSDDEPGDDRRRALAVEPMTCAPDAFRNAEHAHDTGIVLLPPGASASATWTIRAIGE
ncbi:aldose epimerase family protein [Microbacterium allomyrinae]|uniref:Galactose mutarotase n=1 Tax=Microbacterium allomyrinae TaxID=2830666 RepID=A0A9X1LT52_9MICO|nr:galactose mutarotase [Microbacterium allomyrinae]MCC2031579.1 galactose mutarotase [Microbacterium allomyrinae]